ncbi:hypothetical protein GMDG_04730 [Pseudogymnoascus destructans 20631-21]|uniref:Uncharacterized protein n=1 Tax=Pseudogymnoascus destructans (strain ATCC MYA-4855 / 20631-21) TaxID=658429 RepID=L8GCE6_PSED2|nr:hypothetical protein GMDG_04730 [Pseudogymnoascus destructans 20631-21]
MSNANVPLAFGIVLPMESAADDARCFSSSLAVIAGFGISERHGGEKWRAPNSPTLPWRRSWMLNIFARHFVTFCAQGRMGWWSRLRLYARELAGGFRRYGDPQPNLCGGYGHQ